jgi:NAD(P)-dependent dehydrogenase (short-subunit alcohol dehydrogenase family)
MSRRGRVLDIRGRTAFITGAARGIGAATAERLHGKGANVALVGLEPERLSRTRSASAVTGRPSSRRT